MAIKKFTLFVKDNQFWVINTSFDRRYFIKSPLTGGYIRVKDSIALNMKFNANYTFYYLEFEFEVIAVFECDTHESN